MNTGMPTAPASPSGAPFKRRIFIIKKGLQTKFIGLTMGFIVVATLMILGDLYFLFSQETVKNLLNQELLQLLAHAHKILLVKLVGFLIVAAVMTVLMSHKLAGPIYRFEQSARQVATGDLTHRAHLRKGDELMNLQEEFNLMVASLHESMKEDRARADQMAQKLNSLAQTSGLPAEAQNQLQNLAKTAESLTRKFKV